MATPDETGRLPEPLDFERLELSTLGDAEFTLDLAHIFDRTTPPLLDEIAAAAATGACARISAAAHKLKASAGVVGASVLQQHAERLEALAKAGSVPPGPVELASLRQEFQDASAALASYLDGLPGH